MSIITKFPIDLTGKSSTNLVNGEEHLLLSHDGLTQRVVVLDNGGFYTRDLVVYGSDYNALIPNQDYVATYVYADASQQTGLEICGALVIINPALTGSVYVTAQIPGGDYAFSLTALEDTLEYLRGLKGAKPTWAGFIGVQTQWVDGELQRARWSKMGYQQVNVQLESITQAMMAGNQEAETAWRHYALDEYNKQKLMFDTRLKDHVADSADPHNLTSAQLGLGLVANYPVANETISRVGTSNVHYQVPQQLFLEVDEKAIKPLTAHVKRRDNPHRLQPNQANVHSKAQFDQLLAGKLTRVGTAANALGVVSYTETFQYVFETWARISRSGPVARAAGKDIYTDSAAPDELDTWTIDAANNRIRNTTNSSTLIGFISPDKFDDYVLEAQMSSPNGDDDWVGFCIAYVTDNAGRTHTLTALRGLNGAAPLLIYRDHAVNETWKKEVFGGLRWPNGEVATGFLPGNQNGGWDKFPAGVRLKVTRKGDIITVETSQFGETAYVAGAKTVIDLRSDPNLALFRGAQRFGYVAISQLGATWTVLQRPGDVKSYTRTVRDLRASLSASSFTTGQLNPQRMGSNIPTANKILRGDGQWVSIDDVFKQYGSGGNASVQYAGVYSNETDALNNIRITYASLESYPVGVMAIYRINAKMAVGGGNGTGTMSFQQNRMAVRTASGWINV